MQNGNKSLTLNIYNDWNEVDIIQRKNGAHPATITLTGTNPTDLFLTQTELLTLEILGQPFLIRE